MLVCLTEVAHGEWKDIFLGEYPSLSWEGGNKVPRGQAVTNKQKTTTNKNKYLGRKKDFPAFNKTRIQGPAKGAITYCSFTPQRCRPGWGTGPEVQPAFPLPSCVPWSCAVPGQQEVHFFLIYTKVAHKLPVALAKKSLSQSWGVCISPSDHSLVPWTKERPFVIVRSESNTSWT